MTLEHELKSIFPGNFQDKDCKLHDILQINLSVSKLGNSIEICKHLVCLEYKI